MTYSINYDAGKSYLSAVDWNWKFPFEWARSDKDGVCWNSERGLDNKAYHAILSHFGLENHAAEFPPEIVKNSSPKTLAELRRGLERIFKLPKKEIISDSAGNHIKAEAYCSE